MKFYCRLSRKEKGMRLMAEWRQWFAWHPVRVASHDCRWLEYVLRKECQVSFYSIEWEYQAVKET